MYECCENPAHICSYPTELLLIIFECVSAKDLTICRQVCKRWKDVIDDFFTKDERWKQYCTSDFKSLSQDAKKKSYPCLLWRDIYRSLTLWEHLSTSSETIDEFCHSAAAADEIRDCYLLKDGIILIHKRCYIAFYDIATLEITNQSCITGDYTKFIDCGDVIVTLNRHLHLLIIRKPHKPVLTFHHPRPQDYRIFKINSFVVINRDIYCLSYDNSLYHSNIDRKNVDELERPSPERIVTLSSCNGCLHYMTVDWVLYSYQQQENKFTKICVIKNEPNIFDCIFRYKLFEQLEWYRFYMWSADIRKSFPTGPLQHISVMKNYGANTLIIGTNTGSVLIYHKPFTNGEIDFFYHNPVKQFDFVERKDNETLSQQPVVALDVIEIKNGHKILVAMPRKIIVITLTHDNAEVDW